MSDDEINKGDQENDFEFEGSDEFEIPESVDDGFDDDLFIGEPDDSELDDPDAGAWDLDDDAIPEDAEQQPLDEDSVDEGQAGYDQPEIDDEEEPEDAPDTAKSGLGWKSYAAMSAIILGVAAGSATMLFGGGSSPSNQVAGVDPQQAAPAQQQAAPTESSQASEQTDSASVEQRSGDGGGNGSGSGNGSSGGSGSENGGVAKVEAFPDSSDDTTKAVPSEQADKPDSQQAVEPEPETGPESEQVVSGSSESFPEPETNRQPQQSQTPVATLDAPLEGIKDAIGGNSDQLSAIEQVVSDSRDRLDSGFNTMGGHLSEINEKLAMIKDELAEDDGDHSHAQEEAGKGKGEHGHGEKQAETADSGESGSEKDNTRTASAGPKETGKSADADKDTPEPSKKVREAQIRLKAFNYRPGPIDGLLGPRTAAAIKRFQKQHGMDTTGELGEKTRKRLHGDNVATYQPNKHKQQEAGSSSRGESEQPQERQRADGDWYVRGVTAQRAILYKPDGSSYIVQPGTEVPGRGQVAKLNPSQHTVTLVGGETIRRD